MIYLVIDDDPEERITLSAHLTLKGARKEIKQLKKHDPYLYQYLVTQKMRVEE